MGLERIAPGREGSRWVTGEPVTFQAWGAFLVGGAHSARWHIEANGQMMWYHGDDSAPCPFIIEWDTPTPQPPGAGR
jgi:hypothetical protein